MRKYLAALGLIVSCLLAAFPQSDSKNAKALERPNLSGTWVLDPGKNNDEQSSRRHVSLKIIHRDPEVRINRSSDRNGRIVELQTLYYSDGRGETNPATLSLTNTPAADTSGLEKQTTSSKTRWSGKKLVTNSTIRKLMAGHILEFEIIEEWKLSEDKNILTQTSRTVLRSSSADIIFAPAGGPEIKSIYRRIH